jgi:glycosyltransferase involved in cell wall biosynthesis
MLQDEDWFLDDLPPRQRGAAWQTLQERAADIDGFLAVSHYFKVLMQERLRLPPERVHVLHAGIPLAGYEAASVPPEPPAVGYLSRMCREKGLDLLVKSFVSLRNSGRIPNLKLRVAGGSTVQDADFVRTVRRRLAQAGLLNEAEFLPHLEREERIAFLRTLSVLSVPEKRPQAFGAYILEALACGVPVVQPRHGAFPELVEITRGGLLYEPDDLDGLTSALEGLFTDSGKARRIGEAGRSAVLRNFSAEAMARRFLRICETVT